MIQRIKLHKRFVEDLIDTKIPNFQRRVFKAIFDHSLRGHFDGNDHRYKGVEDCWIKYAGQGKNAFRIIYFSKGDDTVFYRCGNHDIEEKIVAPPSWDQGVSLEIEEGLKSELVEKNEDELTKPRTFLKSKKTPLLSQALLSRRLTQPDSIFIISPFYSPEILSRSSSTAYRYMRKTLTDAALEDGAEVHFITRPPTNIEQYKILSDLELDGVNVCLNKSVHSKIYFFKTKKDLGKPQHHPDLGVVGSANFTKMGLPLANDSNGNDELAYSVPSEDLSDLETYCIEVWANSEEFGKVKNKLMKRISNNA